MDSKTPGLTWRPTRYGRQARWRARPDLVKRGYKPAVVSLWIASADMPEPDELTRAYIADRCQALQSQMLVWGRGGLPEDQQFDGTIASLINCYQTDPDSPYKTKRYETRKYYDTLCRMVTRDIGSKRITDLTARDLLRWHGTYHDRCAMGHALVGMVRSLATFGATLLSVQACRELKVTLSDMRFAVPKPREERLTAEQVIAIRREAHRLGRPSIALAQALQFELTLRQKDVIGEWVPIAEPELSAVTYGDRKWLRGLDWKEVDENWILRHVTSKRQKEITVNLCAAPMVIEELGSSRSNFPVSGAIVICERTGRPWGTTDFREWWRKVANAAGIPLSVRNMDSRAGAISEATAAGAPLDQVRKAATHSTVSMTQRYSRGDAEATAEVMRIRVESRKTKPEPR